MDNYIQANPPNPSNLSKPNQSNNIQSSSWKSMNVNESMKIHENQMMSMISINQILYKCINFDDFH